MNSSLHFGHGIRHWWPLDTNLDFLNPASFGAAPHTVLAAQSVWRAQMEQQPVDFFLETLPRVMREQAARLAEFVGADAERLVFVENATSGVQTAVMSHLRERRKSMASGRGRFLLTTDQVYPAVRNMLQTAGRDFGLEYRELAIPFPILSSDDVLGLVTEALTADCELLVIDHVASPTGIIFPIEEIVQAAHAFGVPVVVDGAHAPGMLPLDLRRINADWYTGNCHKWMFAPKGCALLYTAASRAAYTHANIISLGHGNGLAAEFDYAGTRDNSAYLSIGAAIDFIKNLNVEAMRAYQQSLISDLRARALATLGISAPAPASMTAGMLALPLAEARRADTTSAAELRAHCRRTRKVEVPFTIHQGQMLVRPAAQVFHQVEDFDRFIELLSPSEFNTIQDELDWKRN